MYTTGAFPHWLCHLPVLASISHSSHTPGQLNRPQGCDVGAWGACGGCHGAGGIGRESSTDICAQGSGWPRSGAGLSGG